VWITLLEKGYSFDKHDVDLRDETGGYSRAIFPNFKTLLSVGVAIAGHVQFIVSASSQFNHTFAIYQGFDLIYALQAAPSSNAPYGTNQPILVISRAAKHDSYIWL
jgi:hypothetical protein